MSNRHTLQTVRQGVLQFVVFKPILSVLVLLLKLGGWYEEGYISWDSSYLWLALGYNISVCWVLLLMYHRLISLPNL